jgi:tRNA(Arg) A34 adenosine deaminase TadA
LMRNQQLLHQNKSTLRMYTSLEPCVMCLGAAYVSRLASVVWAANDYWAGGTRCLSHASSYLQQHPLQLIPTPCPDLEEKSVDLLKQFFKIRRSDKEACILGPYLK